MHTSSARDAARIRVCHIVHSGKVGGVEVAAALLQAEQHPSINYQVAVLAQLPDGEPQAIKAPDCVGHGLNNPLSVLPVLKWLHRNAPDIVVASLWRSVLVGMVAKLINPKRKFVIFLHNTQYKNVLDRAAHRLGFRLADGIFCDAPATRQAMTAELPLETGQIHVVPLVARGGRSRHTPEAEQGPVGAVAGGEIRCVFWGRLAKQKRLDRAVHLLAELNNRATVPVRLDLLGPDEGELDEMLRLARSLGVEQQLHWHGAADWGRIRDVASGASFFIQLSDFEGLGMAAVEAMQLGLVPVVTPVGQIAEFTSDGVNALHFDSAAPVAERMLSVVGEPPMWERMSAAAVAEWSGQEDLSTAFETVCRQFLANQQANAANHVIRGAVS
ncbi:glycosyltransferase [Arthrobacter pigmenti]